MSVLALEPCYKLDKNTRHIILELHNKCIELDLGNVSFRYFTTLSHDEVMFYISEYKTYWELVVVQRWAQTRDIYKILNGVITYECSEKD